LLKLKGKRKEREGEEWRNEVKRPSSFLHTASKGHSTDLLTEVIEV
jgi:hypothetical protein